MRSATGHLAALYASCRTPEDYDRYLQLATSTKCDYPSCPAPGRLRMQNTAYAHELSNWAVLCDEHQAEADEYWDERWREYYAGLL